MSTYFYKLKYPVTNLQIDNDSEDGIHLKVSVWVNHAFVGSLCVRKTELCNFVLVFASDVVAYYQHLLSGGKCVIEKMLFDDDTLDKSLVVISEYGDVVRIDELERLRCKGVR